MSDKRLIEEWFPIEALSEESVRERRSMTALPPTYYLHVWWARRPLVASRAAVLGALLPANADREKFMYLLGIHGDPVAAKIRIAQATKDDVRLGKEAYGYPRAFTFNPVAVDLEPVQRNQPTILDPTAGGGSIPFESMRLGLRTLGNDLNPVAWLILQSTVRYPRLFGADLVARVRQLGKILRTRVVERVTHLFPSESDESHIPDGYLWARTITCPYCAAVIPLSPNWRLNSKGIGVKLIPHDAGEHGRSVRFEIVRDSTEQSDGTVNGGRATCPFTDCGRIIDGEEIKRQAQTGNMGDQLYAVVYKENRVVGKTKTGKDKIKKVRNFRAPRPEDDLTQLLETEIAKKMPEWDARGIVPDEIRYLGPADRSANYGMLRMTDLFSPRQLFCHCTSVEVYQELLAELESGDGVTDLDKAAMTYIALLIDKLLNYNARMVRWHANREVVAGVFDRHDFSFKWSYAEMAPTIPGLGYDWAIEQTAKALQELIELARPTGGTGTGPLFDEQNTAAIPDISITCRSADDLNHVVDRSIHAVVMDPPYYDNVMYSELADFFYVWLKRTAGRLYPEHFADYLTDKDHEAVANVAKFRAHSSVPGSGGAQRRARREYRDRMQAIFKECHRVLRDDGIMVLMFTHKATGAWDALATGLLEAGFEITASWPVNTEAEGSLHIRDKNAAQSTIFLVCRPRQKAVDDQVVYWEEVEPQVERVVRERVEDFQRLGLRGVDLYLSCFGPALEVFSEHWPMQRGHAVQKPEVPKGSSFKIFEDEEFDPYAVHPEDALNAARSAVKQWRLEQIATIKRHAHLDPVTEFFVLAWDAYGSPQFPADEALKLSRVVGCSFDGDLRGKILEVKNSDVILWDSKTRHSNAGIGANAAGRLLDALHTVARLVHERNTSVAEEWLRQTGLLREDAFIRGLQSMLAVLPRPKAVVGQATTLMSAASDAWALEQVRRLCYSQDIPIPEQSALFE